jgi:hypothetical protein
MSTQHVGAVYKHPNTSTAGSNPDVLPSDVRNVPLATTRISKTSKKVPGTNLVYMVGGPDHFLSLQGT